MDRPRLIHYNDAARLQQRWGAHLVYDRVPLGWQGDTRLPLCPRCNRRVEMWTPECPGCRQRLGGYVGYSAPGWPRKYDWRPELPDDYSFYYIAAHIKAPAQMRRMMLLTGSECPYKVFLNAREIGYYDGGHRSCQWDSDAFKDIELNTGWNLLLVKLAHDTTQDTHRSFFSRQEDHTAFFARLAMPNKSPVAVHDFEKDSFAPERHVPGCCEAKTGV